MNSLRQALVLIFPGPREKNVTPGPATLALLPLLALFQGAVLGAAHEMWLPRYNLPAPVEALVLLSFYGALTGGRPWRGLAELLMGWGRRGAAPGASGAAFILVLFVLAARELVAVLAAVRDDISYPGAALLVAWPVVGRWGSAFTGQLASARNASPLPFLAASSLLLALFFLAIPPAFFVAPAAALAAAGALSAVLGRAVPDAESPARLDADAGIAEAVYLALAAALTLRY